MQGKINIILVLAAMFIAIAVIIWAVVFSFKDLSTVWYW